MFDYYSLSALKFVIQEGSFESAASLLSITPSALSQRIKVLEDRVGCALVIRGRPCKPTEVGQKLCRHVDRVRILEHEIRDFVPTMIHPEESRVSIPIAVNADTLATWFIEVLSQFTEVENISVKLSVDNEDQTSNWLKNGKVLAAVTSHSSPPAGCTSKFLGYMSYTAAASPKFNEKYFLEGITVSSIINAPSLRFNSKDDLQTRWVNKYFADQLLLESHDIPSPQGFIDASLSGIGWGMFPKGMIKNHLETGRLVELKSGCDVDVPLYWQHAKIASKVLDSMSSFVMKVALKKLELTPRSQHQS